MINNPFICSSASSMFTRSLQTDSRGWSDVVQKLFFYQKNCCRLLLEKEIYTVDTESTVYRAANSNM